MNLNKKVKLCVMCARVRPQEECSVQLLMAACITDEEKLYLCVSSPTIKDKPVQIRPWRLGDADFVLDASGPLALEPRRTVFVGGVPRPLKAPELALIMDRLYGGVCYAGIDTDPDLKYPKGAGRVAFTNQQSYIAAISARFVQLQHGDIDKRVEVRHYFFCCIHLIGSSIGDFKKVKGKSIYLDLKEFHHNLVSDISDKIQFDDPG